MTFLTVLIAVIVGNIVSEVIFIVFYGQDEDQMEE